MSEVKVVDDERGRRLQAVGWRLMEQTYMKLHARQPSYWLSPDGERFGSLVEAWEMAIKSWIPHVDPIGCIRPRKD